MGLLSREKGKRFERAIASEIRSRWPLADVRRSSQADRAAQADVYVVGQLDLACCWLECQDARQPTPAAKLLQAERDVERAGGSRWPVVVWRKSGARSTQVTTRAWVLDELRDAKGAIGGDVVVTLSLEDFLSLIAAAEVKS